jgi:multidrug efflux pump subunit AcrA (membrane-fusion protein)
MRKLLIALLVCAAIAAISWQARRMYRTVVVSADVKVPTTLVRRGDLTFNVVSKGELHGGNSEMLTAPLTGGGEMHITYLPKEGDLVKAGDTVVEFDPTEQEYKLKEAQSDVAETKLKVEQAEAQAQAESEEARYALLQAESDVRVAELEVHKNPILPAISARQNDLALKAAQDRMNQLRKDLENRGATNQAAIAVQQAALGKAQIQAATAQRNIDNITLRAKREGYVSIRSNQNGNFMFGMTLPPFQLGDTVRGGQAIAEIPDLRTWEVRASMGELDRGHISPGQLVEISVIALPGQKFTGKVTDLGGTAGPPWSRHFECKMSLDKPSPELRPGMSVNIVVTTETMKQALWIPAQSLFENGSRTFVYVPNGAGYTARDVKLIRRSESQAVIEGVKEGEAVALADPQEETKKKESGARGPVLPK